MVRLVESFYSSDDVWYAVQEDPTDAWDYGSYNKDVAIDMLRQLVYERGDGLIAVIKDGICDKEIYYDDLDETSIYDD